MGLETLVRFSKKCEKCGRLCTSIGQIGDPQPTMFKCSLCNTIMKRSLLFPFDDEHWVVWTRVKK